MKQLAYVAVAVVLLAAMAAAQSPRQTNAVASTPDYEATISVLQTKVAKYESTSTATPVPKNTATPKPKKTPAQKPIDLGNGLEIVYYYFAPGFSGNFALLGEVRNISDQPIVVPVLRITLLDDSGNIVDSLDASPVLPLVNPNEQIPFSADYINVPRNEWSVERFQVCDTSQGFDPSLSANLALHKVKEVQKDSNRLQVQGIVANNNDVDMPGVRVVAAVYGPDNSFIGSGVAALDAAIPAHKTERFDLAAYELYGLNSNETGYTYKLYVSNAGVTVSTCPS